MITNYRIYDPKNLELSNTKVSNDLFCDFEINLNGKLIRFESVQLKELISLLNKIAETTTNFGTDEYTFELNGQMEYMFHWNRVDNSSKDHAVTVTSNKFEHRNVRLWSGHLHGLKESFYLKLLKDLLEAELFELAKKYGDLFFEKYLGNEYKYRIADKVKTVLNENVKTEREGFIIGKSYHINEKSNMYFLMIDGKKYKKQYFERDLELTN